LQFEIARARVKVNFSFYYFLSKIWELNIFRSRKNNLLLLLFLNLYCEQV